MNRRASCVGTFEVFEAAHVALRTLLAFSQPVNCIFWPIGMLNWLVAASKLHKHRETCCTAKWPFNSFLILCYGAYAMSEPQYSEWTVGSFSSVTCAPIFMQFTGCHQPVQGFYWPENAIDWLRKC